MTLCDYCVCFWADKRSDRRITHAHAVYVLRIRIEYVHIVYVLRISVSYTHCIYVYRMFIMYEHTLNKHVHTV